MDSVLFCGADVVIFDLSGIHRPTKQFILLGSINWQLQEFDGGKGKAATESSHIKRQYADSLKKSWKVYLHIFLFLRH